MLVALVKSTHFFLYQWILSPILQEYFTQNSSKSFMQQQFRLEIIFCQTALTIQKHFGGKFNRDPLHGLFII